mgnify:CR=1 FL=1
MGKNYERHIMQKNTILKFTLCAVFFLMLLIGEPCFAQRDTADTDGIESQIVKQQAKTAGINRITEELSKYVNDERAEILEDFNPEEIINDASEGRFEFNFKSVLNNILRYLFNELYQNIDILIKLAVLIVICALLNNLQASFFREGAGEIAFYACFILIVSVLLVSFGTAMKMGMQIIDDMVGFMYASFPVLVTLLVAGGNITSGGVFQPVLLMAVEITATIIKNVFMPLIYLSTIISIINNISDKIQLKRLADFIKQATTWALGSVLTIFIGIVSLQGSLGAVIDGVTSKAAKFAIGAFIPVVGKTLSDAADTVIGCTLLIKNAAGVVTLIGILVICAVPLIKLIAMILLYKAASALFEPISEKRITNCISEIAGSMVHIFAITVAVSIMFIISVTALISAGNLSAMLR